MTVSIIGALDTAVVTLETRDGASGTLVGLTTFGLDLDDDAVATFGAELATIILDGRRRCSPF